MKTLGVAKQKCAALSVTFRTIDFTFLSFVFLSGISARVAIPCRERLVESPGERILTALWTIHFSHFLCQRQQSATREARCAVMLWLGSAVFILGASNGVDKGRFWMEPIFRSDDDAEQNIVWISFLLFFQESENVCGDSMHDLVQSSKCNRVGHSFFSDFVCLTRQHSQPVCIRRENLCLDRGRAAEIAILGFIDGHVSALPMKHARASVE